MTPKLLAKQLQTGIKGFSKFWSRKDNLSKRIDGTFTYCGLLSEFLLFLSQDFEKIKRESLEHFFQWVEEALIEKDEELVPSLKTCFLDNLVHQEFAYELSELYGDETSRFLQYWDRES